MPAGEHTLATARESVSTADSGIEKVWSGRKAMLRRAAQCLRARVAHRPIREVRMTREIQCPERGRDQLALMLLDFAFIQAVEMDSSRPKPSPRTSGPISARNVLQATTRVVSMSNSDKQVLAIDWEFPK